MDPQPLPNPDGFFVDLNEPFGLWPVEIGTRHEEGFVLERPRGSGNYAFVHFLVPVRIRLEGRMERVDPGDCILLSPESPTYYHGDGVGLANDFFHFTGHRAPQWLAEFELPTDRILRPLSTSFVSPMLGEMLSEITTRQARWRLAVELLFRSFCLELSRQIEAASRGRPSHRKLEMRRRFRRIRREVLSEFARDWSVPSIAREAHLSPSRFATLYREFFQVSPIEDLIRVRLRHACWLLAHTDDAVAQVGAESGFDNVYYFSRLFKRRTGLSPSAYRRRAQEQAGEEAGE